MAHRILLFALIVAGFTSCATYRTGQTPDDVYYSPAKEVSSYVQVDRGENNRLSYNESNLEDRRLRQQIRDPRFRFDDNIYWNTPSYNSWGWNTWYNPYNTWGWNNYWGNNYGWGNYYGYGGYNNFMGYGYKGYPNYICIPGGNNLIVIAGPGAASHSTSIRYSSPIQRFTNAGSNFSGKMGSGTNSGRYFNGSNTNSGSRRTGFFSGGSNNNSSSNWNTGSSSSSSSGTSTRTFSSGSSSSGSSSSSSGSSSSSSSSGSSAGGRRN